MREPKEMHQIRQQLEDCNKNIDKLSREFEKLNQVNP